ncbi:MAG TPA: CPBP family glutamic-type intramembrane protease, partial [Propionibacteriaceae bacterium]|nr:CPBP family glutamic-type intramembrane protease [Propionibacteriaceae bacterium]
MSPMLRLVRRYPLTVFFLLTYAVAWALWPFGLFGAFGPLVAALIVVPIAHGRAGLRELGARLVRWRVGWLWWAMAVGVPLGLHALTAGLVDITGAERPTTAVTTALLAFALRLVNPTDGPLAEEPAWRGYAQPVAQGRGWTPLATATLFALLIAGWHLPLFFLEEGGLQLGVLVPGLVTTMAVTYWYTWLFNRSRGSSLLPVVSHNVEG